jgi:deoxyribonuclease-4
MKGRQTDELGAHVSAQGGAQNAPARAAEIGAVVFQLFTKQPNRWAEPVLSSATGDAFRNAREEFGIQAVASHDSYLINLASPDPALWERSLACFRGELERCEVLGLEYLVTHPGNATDGDVDAGIHRNALGLTRALEASPGVTRVLLEITAGSGTSIGATFENLAAIRAGVPEPHRSRVGVCFDTCHVYAAGYDLVNDYEAVWESFDRVLGLDRLWLFHLNDSRHPLGSRKDRHADIGEGALGEDPFRRIMRDARFTDVPKVLETPKGEDGVAADRENLARLRRFRATG